MGGGRKRLRYVSTRGSAESVGFEDVLLAGLAPDGGLYLPESWPQLSPAMLSSFAGRPYYEVAAAVMQPYLGNAMTAPAFLEICRASYDGFHHPAVAPLVQLAPADFVLELFHGPTLAFKDIALQLLGRLFDYVLAKRHRRITIVGATSGDTGSAAIEGCRGRDAMDVFILHPFGRVSDVQRRQMTSVTDANIHNIALEGSFDDCQTLVKAMFNHQSFRERLQLSAVNSINWARIMAQVVYYVTSAVALGAPQRAVGFSVPSGNFGDVFAGYVAARMGVPIARLIVATNRNDILARFFASGVYEMSDVAPTMSPSMDIQISSNFERRLFEISGRDGAETARHMGALAQDQKFSVSQNELAACKPLFAAARVDEATCAAEINNTYRATGWLPDPHTAIGLAAMQTLRPDLSVPMVTLATAHPAKFPDAVEVASGIRPSLPSRLGNLMDRPERFDRLPNDLIAVETYIEERARILQS